MPAKRAIDMCPSIGDMVEIYWPVDNRYYSGMISHFNSTTHQHRIVYDDGDVEQVNLSQETWRYFDRNKNRKVESPIAKSGCGEKSTVEDAIDLLSIIFTSWLRREARCHLPTSSSDIVMLAIRDAIDRTTFYATHGEMNFYKRSQNCSWLRSARKVGVEDEMRTNYSHWTVPLSDCEWEVEKQALLSLSHKIANVKEKLSHRHFASSIIAAIAILLAAKHR